jgi:hypothetical protein
MDFIRKDKDLYNILTKLGQQAESGGLDPNKNAKVLQVLSKNLGEALQSYVPPKPSTQEGFHGGDKENPNPKLYLESLQTDIDFLDYLSFANIKHGSTQLVYLNGMLPETIDKSEYVKYPKPKDNQGKEFKYWIHKRYIRYLLEDLQSSGQSNKLLATRVGKLIKQFSDNSGESFDPADKSGQSQQIDALPKLINPENPMEQGNIYLFTTDLKSDNDFNDWLNRAQLQLAKGGKNVPVADMNNICDFISYLYRRAYNYANLSGNNKERIGLGQYYAKQIYSIAQTHSCPIGKPAGQPNQGGSPDKDKQQGGREGLTDNEVVAQLRSIVPNLPLNTRTIDFRKISEWALLINRVLPKQEQFPTGDMDGLRENIVNYLKSGANPAGYQYDLSKSPDDVLALLKEPGQSLKFLSLLRQLVDNVAESVQQIISVYGSKLEADRQAYQYILNQVGHDASSYSIAQQNKTRLSSVMRSLQSTLPRYMQQMQQKGK